MALSGARRHTNPDTFQDMLLNMDFDASTSLRQPQQPQPKRLCHGQLASEDITVGAPNGAERDPFASTDLPRNLQLSFTCQRSECNMMRDNLQQYVSVGDQSTDDPMLGVGQQNGLTQPDPLHQDSGSGEPLSRDKTGWEATAGTSSHGMKDGNKQQKTERQQMLNKAAQQRYRERKKAKANELKEAVTSLQDKVEELSKVHAEKDELQEKVGALEKELAVKEACLATLQQKQSGSLLPDTLSQRATQGQSTEGPEGSAQCAQRYIEDVQKLKSWLGTHGYLSGGWMRSPLVAGDIPTEKRSVLEKLAHDCHASCQQCLKKHGNLESVGAVEGAPNPSGPLHFQGDASQWQQLVEQLVLDKSVKEKALQVRSQYIKTLEALFQERQRLNINAVKVLLPREVGTMSLRGKASISTPLFEKLSTAFATADVLRQLRYNLAQEQQELAELEHVVYVKLLDPVQLSRCIMTSFPQHCDAVSLLNAIHAAS